jgi:endonuclease YncB( thermonuclease family)
MYQHKTKVDRWGDGDTLLSLINLGFHTHKEEPLRLAIIRYPELRGLSTNKSYKSTYGN